MAFSQSALIFATSPFQIATACIGLQLGFERGLEAVLETVLNKGRILEQIFGLFRNSALVFSAQSIDMTGISNEQGCQRKSGHPIYKQAKIRFETAKNQKFEPSIP